jgi:protein-S-isoprenylcysteine O-methyltransferase Ste14
MRASLIRAILILPGTVLVFVPSVLYVLTTKNAPDHRLAESGEFQFWLGILFLVLGLILAAWTVKLQMTIGKGTPAPWDPPKNLVIEGPYRYVRNPMITGVFCILIAESFILRSWTIAIWLGIFFVGNLVYLPMVEEKGLEERFGDPYHHYKANVPRWIPRLSPYRR